MGRFEKGRSGNPGGRRPYPKAVKEALKAQALPAVQRLIDLSEHAPDDKVRLAATVKVLELIYGKVPLPVFLSGPAGAPIESKAVTVHRVDDHSPQHLASVLEVLARVGRLPASSGAAGALPGADATADEVHSASAAPDAGGIPPP